MKLLITGGAGFIGSHIADHYHAKSHEVFVLDNLASGHRENIPFIDEDHFFEVDVCDTEKVTDIIKLHQFDVVIHLAAVVSVVDTVNQPVKSNKVNIDATLNLLETNREHNPQLKKFVFASSAAVYGNNPQLPKTTQSIVQPESPYAVQKYAGEQYTKMYHHLYDLPTTALRFFNIYGPKQDPNSQYSGVISIMKRKFDNDETFTFFGDGEQTRDFVYVKDLVNAIALVVENSETNGEVLNVGTGNQTSLKDIFSAFESSYQKTVDYQFEPARKGDVKHSVADVTPLKEIGYEPQYTINTGLEEYLNS
ncbi:NAD-dependent dehydratase [Staphylococcus muscae]|uniref:NAD dependent epimerase/dehydratase family protein n=1 Tax=Staphylococcus muscae TaxID=1294 RepID=A0A240C927_9STAP|nr:NAD-dependent epimerase/dehydratase family protein [Staphylococcus muscae]AVQ33857.1 NAD-dependent dehydratase [Staphylococcus muscae]PNZ04253.1 NAD-dependent dehydratase [Staphylococcus muscae]GGA83745.1 NAD-dependent dehydratase [Staphylococcus muscae]SNW04465.1 NAD dependent epimerase/dehydratase family protein [Staphylococcus muscae]